MSEQNSPPSPHAASPQMFLNLAVKDLPRAMKFFTDLGYYFNPQFTSQDGACLALSEQNYCMLLTENFFKSFIDRPLSEPKKSIASLVALSCATRGEVDTLVDKSVKLGGREIRPAQDHGFMYSRGFEDLDGHIWEYFWMNPAYVQK